MSDCKLKLNEHLSKLKGRNIAELSRQTGVPRQLLFSWINESRLPHMKHVNHLKKLADFFQMSLDDLLTGTSDQQMITSVSFVDDGNTYNLSICKNKK